MQKGIKLSFGIFLGLLQTLAFAGNCPGYVTFTPAVGYYYFAQNREFNNSAIPNAAIAYNFDSHWAIEGGLGFLNATQKPANLSNVHGTLYTADGIFRFIPYQFFEPYVSAGVGVLNLSQNGSNAPNQANIHAAIGSQLFVDSGIAFRGEVRDLYTFVGGKNDVMFNLGLSFLFRSC